MVTEIRGVVGGNLEERLIFGQTIGTPLKASDTAGIKMRWQAFMSRVMAVVPRASRNAMMPVFLKSQIYCPKDTGALVDSGYLEMTDRLGINGGPVVEVGYGRNGSPYYALVVHEVLTVKHKPPTRSKFLQAAYEEYQGRILPMIAAQLRV